MNEQSSNDGGSAASPPISLLQRHRDFRRLWTGETVSVFGSRMGEVPVSLAAVTAIGATLIVLHRWWLDGRLCRPAVAALSTC